MDNKPVVINTDEDSAETFFEKWQESVLKASIHGENHLIVMGMRCGKSHLYTHMKKLSEEK